jgi:hypothetical protein
LWQAPPWFGVIGAAFAVAYCISDSWLNVRQRGDEVEKPRAQTGWMIEDPNLERWGVFLGLLYGLGLSLRKTLKGGANVYLGNENYWDRVCWNWVALFMLSCLFAGAVWSLYARFPRDFRGNATPHASAILWLVLIAENLVAQIVTGPVFGPGRDWNDLMFNILYLILFVLTAVIVYHYQFVKSHATQCNLAKAASIKA